ncbi:histone deacetylase family protein [Plasticicumulans acidivorans]|uniref:Acetoin utilization deacetylase AcuC-like enzyme n=1 Tax=Plasticicumulans acidivorans TaxID=886464 RepID=A0A317MRQ1_9GAMM|nr:histone deacetylase [Plasticicumulans acidivorans]PWV59083.1 acetoin utilization deacetylase AcuC-like enzyme [Plasticicumulans acidivorans]
MKAFYCDHFVLPLPAGHRFPMDKYRRLRERVAADSTGRFELHEPAAADDDELGRAHAADYVARVSRGELDAREQRVLGFPWSAQLIERSRRSAGATIAACRAALADGVAVNLAGGTHHAMPAGAQGFCVFNDSAVAARAMQAEGRVRRVIVIDCDVHQGNGTAAILRDDPSVFTFSIHGAKNFPFRKEISDLDVELADGCSDADYLAALEPALDSALTRAGAELAIFLAGADPYAGDRLGRLQLSKAGLAARDELVFARCARHGLPVAVTMAGGYADLIDDIVDIHFATVCRAARHRP